MKHHVILPNQDDIMVTPLNLVLYFAGKRRVVGTSCLNGGFQTELKHVFIHCDKDPITGLCEMKGATYEEHLAKAAQEAGIDSTYSSGLSTAAPVEYAAFEQETFQQYTVTAVVTGGILHNGRRVGDLADMWEQDGIYHVLEGEEEIIHKSGTVNIVVHINANLSNQAMITAVMLSTEAKVAAIQELQLQSCYSKELATGSGTDGIIIVADSTSDIHLTQAGSDTKLGQCIGRAVKRAVRREMEMQIAFTEEQN